MWRINHNRQGRGAGVRSCRRSPLPPSVTRVVICYHYLSLISLKLGGPPCAQIVWIVCFAANASTVA